MPKKFLLGLSMVLILCGAYAAHAAVNSGGAVTTKSPEAQRTQLANQRYTELVKQVEAAYKTETKLALSTYQKALKGKPTKAQRTAAKKTYDKALQNAASNRKSGLANAKTVKKLLLNTPLAGQGVASTTPTTSGTEVTPEQTWDAFATALSAGDEKAFLATCSPGIDAQAFCMSIFSQLKAAGNSAKAGELLRGDLKLVTKLGDLRFYHFAPKDDPTDVGEIEFEYTPGIGWKILRF
jgi:hypothetical protein